MSPSSKKAQAGRILSYSGKGQLFGVLCSFLLVYHQFPNKLNFILYLLPQSPRTIHSFMYAQKIILNTWHALSCLTIGVGGRGGTQEAFAFI